MRLSQVGSALQSGEVGLVGWVVGGRGRKLAIHEGSIGKSFGSQFAAGAEVGGRKLAIHEGSIGKSFGSQFAAGVDGLVLEDDGVQFVSVCGSQGGADGVVVGDDGVLVLSAGGVLVLSAGGVLVLSAGGVLVLSGVAGPCTGGGILACAIRERRAEVNSTNIIKPDSRHERLLFTGIIATFVKYMM